MPQDEQAAAGRLLEGVLPLKDRTALEYGLAHVRDAQSRAEEAADLLARANARRQGMLQRQGKGYDPAAHARFVDCPSIAVPLAAGRGTARPWHRSWSACRPRKEEG
jgi:hypothetical protein